LASHQILANRFSNNRLPKKKEIDKTALPSSGLAPSFKLVRAPACPDGRKTPGTDSTVLI